MRVCGHLVSILKMPVGNTLLVAESVSQTWNTSRASPLTLVTTKTPGNTGTLETPLSRTSGNTPTFKESERGSVSALRRTAAGGALPIPGDPSHPPSPPHRPSVHTETQSDGSTASPRSVVAAPAPSRPHTLRNRTRPHWSMAPRATRLIRMPQRIE